MTVSVLPIYRRLTQGEDCNALVSYLVVPEEFSTEHWQDVVTLEWHARQIITKRLHRLRINLWFVILNFRWTS